MNLKLMIAFEVFMCMRRPKSSGLINESPTPGEAEVRSQLDRILWSSPWKNSDRLKRFLKFAVEATLAGTIDQLKESVLGRIVFDRGPKFDPRADSIVRVESQRLRRKLRDYYAREGRADPVSIIFRPGSYTAAFAYRIHPQKRGKRPHDSLVSQPRQPVVVVLPLSNLSTDPEQEYFCDGITDDIIYTLSCIPGLNVIGHTTVFALKGSAKDARNIAARFGAEIVVGGSIRKSEKQFRIFAEIADAVTGQVRWARAFDERLEGVFRVEQEIASAVAQAVQVTLPILVSRTVISNAPDMNAYLLYLQGRYAWNRMSASGYRTAAEIFERTISLYPTYAAPYAGLADAYSYLAIWGCARPRDVFPRAQRAALQALNLDPLLPQAHTARAAASAFYDWNWEEGLRLSRRATELGPSFAFGQQVYGCCLLARGETDLARVCFERGVILDPLSVRAHRMLGWALYLQRRALEAEKWLQAALVLDREPAQTHYLLAHVYLNQRRFEAALEQARKCQTDPPDALCLGVLGACLARLRNHGEAREILARLARLGEDTYVDPHAIAQVQIALAEIGPAIVSVGNILEERSPFAFVIRLDPEFDALRDDPRFRELLSSLRLQGDVGSPSGPR